MLALGYVHTLAWPARKISGAAGALTPADIRSSSLLACALPSPPAVETEKWKKISYVFMPFCGFFFIFTLGRHFQHEHHDDHDKPQMPWMKKRDKDMPWSLSSGGKRSNCDLFDYGPCWQKYKAAQAEA